jgi:HPt (histidine-containing phosphotransfer) domain-containing protein
METPVVDFSFIYDMSDNDTNYVYEILDLFIETVSTGLLKLEQLIRKTNDFEAIGRQAHFLKSSANVIKVRNMYDDLLAINTLARQGTGKDKMIPMLDNMIANFKEARPILIAEKDKNKPAEVEKER